MSPDVCMNNGLRLAISAGFTKFLTRFSYHQVHIKLVIVIHFKLEGASFWESMTIVNPAALYGSVMLLSQEELSSLGGWVAV